MTIRELFPITILFILLAGLFYLVPGYTEQYLSPTSAAVLGEEDRRAIFVSAEDLQELIVGDYLIVGGRTARLVEIAPDAVLLETREGQYIITVGETILIYDTEILLTMIG